MKAVQIFIVSFSLFWVVSTQVERTSFIFRLMDSRKLRIPQNPANSLRRELYFIQDLDHFSPLDRRTWEQRYYVTSTFFDGTGPILLYIGGESALEYDVMNWGSWINYARETNALMIAIEHRFYGKSQPFNSLATENLKYLSSQQALADLANFISTMKNENYPDNKWISIGGSYPGSLSLWLRAKYPHLLDGAISSSGPVKAKVDFFEYLGVVDQDMQTTNPECPRVVQKAIEDAVTLYNNGRRGWDELRYTFNICEELKTDDDIHNLFSSIIGIFYTMAQYNDPDAQQNLAWACNIMTRSAKPELDRLADLVRKFYPFCLDVSYTNMIAQLKQEDDLNGNYRQWIYQTCTEFGWYQTDNLPDHPYSSLFPQEFFVKQCSDIFDNRITLNFLQEAVKNTNMFYGSTSPVVNNAVIVHGSFDPWHAMGILRDVNPTVPAIVINGTSHCFDLQTRRATDPLELTRARETILRHLRTWI